MKHLKPLACYAAIFYIMIGLVVSNTLAYYVPATNNYGRAYLTALWLPWVLQKPLGYVIPVPNWCFSFERN